MRFALTGGTGFVGRHLIQRLLDQGHGVTAWHRGPVPQGKAFEGVHWIAGQLGDFESAIKLVQGCDAVIHSALWRGGNSFLDAGENPLEYWQRNATGGLQLLEASKRAKVRRFVFLSSGAVHDSVLGDRPLDETHPLLPSSLYGACKASVETLVHHYGSSVPVTTATLRPTAIYGLADPPESSKWYSLIQSVCQGQDVDAVGGSKSVHVDDVAKAAILLAQSDGIASGQTYNCCDRMISDHEVAEIAKRLTGSRSVISGKPKTAKHQIVTDRIQALGMRFGGDQLLEQTVQQLIDATHR